MNASIRIKKEYEADVCVLGGGPAGFAAAVAAARTGAKTILVEKYGMLGGAMTVGGIPLPGLFHSLGEKGWRVIGGVGWELVSRLAEKGWARLPKAPYTGPHPTIHVPVNGFAAACEMDDMCREAGVKVLFHTSVADLLQEGQKITHVLLTSHEGLAAVHAGAFVDCTGDGDVAAMAGAPFEISETLQPGSLNCVFEGIDYDRLDMDAADEKFARAVEEGRLQRKDVWGYGGRSCRSLWAGRGSNLNHVSPLNSADSESRSAAEPEARASIRRLLEWARAEVPGCEKMVVSACCPESWARESRRILGESYIRVEDYVKGAVPEDSVCYSFYPVDLHQESDKPLYNVWLDAEHVPGIPYGALVPQRTDNLLVAGRCISGDQLAHAAYRVQASCMATGQAAGVAASMAAAAGVAAREVPVARLQQTLREQGALVPDTPRA